MKKHSNLLIVMLIVGLFSTCLATASVEGKGSIEGLVINSDGLPAAGIWVGIVGTNLGTATDLLGWFRIDSISPGTFEICLYEKGSRQSIGENEGSVTVEDGKVTKVSIQISSVIGELRKDEDEVEGERDRIDSKKVKVMKSDYLSAPIRLYSMKERSSGIVGEVMPRHKSTAKSNEVPQAIQNLDQSAMMVMPPLRNNYLEPARQPQDMFFQSYGSHGFVNPQIDKFSTFALDVDDASYTLVRRYLREGNLPPADAVRIEEFINHFNYDYNPPDNGVFRIFTELSNSPFTNGMSLLKVGIKGAEVSRNERKPLNLTFVIDVSGSMGGGNRLGLVKNSLLKLINQLDERDRVGIVAYGSQAYYVLNPTNASDRLKIASAIRSLSAGGSTFAEAGLKLGFKMANNQFVSGNGNRVILCSDGVANVGQTGADGIMNDIERFAARGITLSTFGFGMGNYNDVLMEQLSQRGNGRYAYINDEKEATRQMVTDFVGNTQLLARDVKVQVQFDPTTVAEYRLLGYENRDVPDHSFRDNNQDGGEIGPGHEVTALYELRLKHKASSSSRFATVTVRWMDENGEKAREMARAVSISSLRTFNSSRPEYRLAVVVARFADDLKLSRLDQVELDRLSMLARQVANDYPGEQTSELLELINRTKQFSLKFSDRIRPYESSDYRTER